MEKSIVFLTGAGISAESGLPTFRGTDGLWENHRFEDVASPKAWVRDPELVLRFYNERRRAVLRAKPNAAHLAIAELERRRKLTIVTQNVDDLHERAGSRNVVHLHGEICKARSSLDPRAVFDIQGSELNLGQLCPLGSQLRPHIVWFGESVPLMEHAIGIVRAADVLIIVGTSLQVYPAASLVGYTSIECRITYIDPATTPPQIVGRTIEHIQSSACDALPKIVELLNNEFSK